LTLLLLLAAAPQVELADFVQPRAFAFALVPTFASASFAAIAFAAIALAFAPVAITFSFSSFPTLAFAFVVAFKCRVGRGTVGLPVAFAMAAVALVSAGRLAVWSLG
jgi:hypothetical protein